MRPLGFGGFWLAGWTIGVCVLQALAITGAGGIVDLFVFTHGGAEVAVLTLMTRELAGQANSPTAPMLVLDHSSLRATWRRSGRSLVMNIVEGGFLTLVHVALFGSALLALASASGSPTAWAWAAGVLCVWTATGAHALQAVVAVHRALGEVVLVADVDAVRVAEGRREHRFPLSGLQVGVARGHLLLSAPGASLDLPCGEGSALDELVDALDVMAARAVPARAVPEPVALANLRRAE